MLRKHLVLENGEFFKTGDGTLACWQRLTVRDAQAFVKGCNELISAAFARLAEEGLAIDRTRWSDTERHQWRKWDVATLELVQAAARDQHRWLTLEPGRIRFTMRGSEHYFRHLKRDMLNPGQDSARWLKFMTDTAWGLEQRPNELIISLGVGEHQPIRVVVPKPPAPKSKYHDDLMAYSKTLPVEVARTTQAELEAKLVGEAKAAGSSFLAIPVIVLVLTLIAVGGWYAFRANGPLPRKE